MLLEMICFNTKTPMNSENCGKHPIDVSSFCLCFHLSRFVQGNTDPMLPSGSLWMNCVLTVGARSVLPVNGVNETLSVETRAMIPSSRAERPRAMNVCSVLSVHRDL